MLRTRKVRQPTVEVPAQIELPIQREHRYSFSQVDTYLKCPGKYKFHYIDKKKKVGFAPAMIFGSFFHKYPERVLKARLTQSDLTTSQRDELRNEILQGFESKYKEDKQIFQEYYGDGVVVPGLGLSDMAKQFILISNHWDKEVLPEFDPVAVEKEIITDINGIPFIMYIDAIRKYQKSMQVIDWKVSKKSKGDSLAASSLQLSIYSAVTNISNVAFCSIIRTDEMKKWSPRIEFNQATRHPKEIEWAVKVVESVVENIKSGSFPLCSPENFLCSSSFCDYWDICRGQYERPKTKKPSWMGV